MMDFNKVCRRFRQFGGWRLIHRYMALGLAPALVGQTLSIIWHRRSFKSLYPLIEKRTQPYLRTRYAGLMDNLITEYGHRGGI